MSSQQIDAGASIDDSKLLSGFAMTRQMTGSPLAEMSSGSMMTLKDNHTEGRQLRHNPKPSQKAFEASEASNELISGVAMIKVIEYI